MAKDCARSLICPQSLFQLLHLVLQLPILFNADRQGMCLSHCNTHQSFGFKSTVSVKVVPCRSALQNGGFQLGNPLIRLPRGLE